MPKTLFERMSANPIGIGDPVEVRVMVRTRTGVDEQWLPATVSAVSARNGSIAVAFSDGERLAVRRDQWRRQPGW